MTRTGELPLLLTQGEPAGIGPDLSIALWMARKALAVPCFALIGSAEGMLRRARDLGADVPVVRIADMAEAPMAFERGLPVIDHGLAAAAEPGVPDPTTAPATIRSIALAVELARASGAAVVTNPIAKSVLYETGFAHPGHTEFLAALCADPQGVPPQPVMMIWSDMLAVVPVTIHIPLARVPSALTKELIVETGRIVDADLRRRFGMAAPRIAVAGLNPHAGESGTIGLEDEAVVRPAITELRRLGIDASGPLPADTMFHARVRAAYDVALTMYHDQGLIPAKTLAFDEGVNVTLGLPIIRTSPDHGTAFDIAGKGIARPDSLLAALRLARRLADAGSDS